MTTTSDLDWAALAREVRARRAALRLPVDLASRGGPSEMTVRKIETGQPTALRPLTKDRVEYVLKWPAGLLDRILAGDAERAELDEVVDCPAPPPTAAANGRALQRTATSTTSPAPAHALREVGDLALATWLVGRLEQRQGALGPAETALHAALRAALVELPSRPLA